MSSIRDVVGGESIFGQKIYFDASNKAATIKLVLREGPSMSQKKFQGADKYLPFVAICPIVYAAHTGSA